MWIRNFVENEDAAVTVDWVVLAAACVSLAIGVTNVTAAAMGDLSRDLRAELTNTDPSRNYFDELMNYAVFGEYTAFAGTYGADWENGGVNSDGLNWAQAAYDSYASLDSETLLNNYDYHYEVATTGDPLTNATDAESVDHVAVLERMLTDRGFSMPDGNMTADEVRALYESET